MASIIVDGGVGSNGLEMSIAASLTMVRSFRRRNKSSRLSLTNKICNKI